jgi:hypothetical protein
MKNQATLRLDLNELQYLQECLSKDAFMPECFDDLKHLIASAIQNLEWEEADQLITEYLGETK